MLQVRSDCPPARLLEFLAGESGLAANEAAESVASSKAEEEALLEKVLLPFPSLPTSHANTHREEVHREGISVQKALQESSVSAVKL